MSSDTADKKELSPIDDHEDDLVAPAKFPPEEEAACKQTALMFTARDIKD
jgi:hypothetical protein